MAAKSKGRATQGCDDESLLAGGVLSVQEASAFLSVSRPTIYELVRRRELRFLKKGRKTFIPRRSAIDYLRRALESSPRFIEEPPQLARARAARRARSDGPPR